jgi:hypothetical protein
MKQLVEDKGWGEGCYLHEQWTESWPSLSVLRCRTLQMLVGHCLGVREGCPLLDAVWVRERAVHFWTLSGCERGLSIVGHCLGEREGCTLLDTVWE